MNRARQAPLAPMQTENPKTPAPGNRHPLWRLVLWFGSTAIGLGILAGLVVAFLSGQTLKLPDWAATRLGTQINAQLSPARIGLGGLEITFREGAAPIVALTAVRVFDGNGRFVAWVPRGIIALDRAALLGGAVSPQSVAIDGLRISLSRNAQGEFEIALGDPEGIESIGGSPAALLDEIDQILAIPGLSALQVIEAQNVSLVLDDQVAHRRWSVSDGNLRLERTADGASFRVGFDTLGHQGAPATVAFSIETRAEDLTASLGASIENISAGDIAAWGPSLAWLRLLEAPVAGSLRLGFTGDGSLEVLNAALDIGAGFARVPGTERAVGVDRGRAYFGFRPETQTVEFTEISISTSDMSFDAEGQMFLQPEEDIRPAQLITQLQFRDVAISPSGLLDHPARFSGGGIDMRLQLDPFMVQIGQLALADGDRRLMARGEARVEDGVFINSMDISLNEIDHQGFLSLWPRNVVPHTRSWLERNLQSGRIVDATAAIRVRGSEKPEISVGFQYDDATIRYMEKQRPMRDTAGYGSLRDDRLTIVAESGHVTAPEGGDIDVAGSVFVVPNVQARPGIGHISIKASGPITAMLSVLDQEPFRFLQKAERPVSLARGHGIAEAEIRVPLVQFPEDKDIFYEAKAVALDVVSEVLVEGRRIEAERLEVTASRDEGLWVKGQARIDGVAIDGGWHQPLETPGAAARLTGAVTITQAGADAFSLGLPDGTIRGRGLGRVEIDFPQGAPPNLRSLTDLNRLILSAPPLGWSKSAGRTGELEVLATLSEPPVVDQIRLSAPGLEAEGAISLNPDGSLDRAVFSNVRVGDWFNGQVDLVGRGASRPMDVAVLGGRLDIRRSDVGASSGKGNGRLDVALNRLVISDGISLTGLRGDFDPNRGLAGRFSARVNRSTPVSGRLAPSEHGTAVFLTSENGGAVLRDAGILANAHGGALELTLTPRNREGYYDGKLTIKDMRVRDAPALAELLSAVSIIGFLEQLDGTGIAFSNVSAEFVLTPDRVVVTGSRAVGASLGLTMDGEYDLATHQMKMQGVITPIYIINGVGQLVSRRGEGLFGFSYRLNGASSDPQVRVNPLSILAPGFLRDLFSRSDLKVEE